MVTKQDLTRQSAVQMMAGLQARAFSSEELVQAHIDRIEAVNPMVNAVTHERFDQALAEARRSDELRAKDGDAAPKLLGMPVTIKEMYAVEGLPWTGGVYRHRNRVADRDAEVVQRVREAGAIVLCKTNTSTLTMTHETDNVLFGRTSHPLDSTRTPGGSSGGEAALIASFASPWGVGSDLGGSIRLPAHLCGIDGIRPTHGLIPTDGEYPSWPHHRHMNSAGPLARSVEDVAVLLEVLAGRTFSLDLEGLTVFWLAAIRRAPVQPEMADRFESLVGRLAQGMPVHAADAPVLDGIVDLWQQIILSDRGRAAIAEIQEADRFSFELEVLKALFGRSHVHKWVLALLFGSRYLGPSAKRIARLQDEVEQARRRFDALVGAAGVLLLPVFPWTAPKHGKIANTVYTNRGDRILPYLVLANILGYPAMTVYAGTTKAGLPFGIQVVAGRHREHHVLAIARQLEAIVQE